jgi:hypothetical protein
VGPGRLPPASAPRPVGFACRAGRDPLGARRLRRTRLSLPLSLRPGVLLRQWVLLMALRRKEDPVVAGGGFRNCRNDLWHSALWPDEVLSAWEVPEEPICRHSTPARTVPPGCAEGTALATRPALTRPTAAPSTHTWADKSGMGASISAPGTAGSSAGR